MQNVNQSGQQQIVQFYPNQTQYIINLQNVQLHNIVPEQQMSNSGAPMSRYQRGNGNKKQAKRKDFSNQSMANTAQIGQLSNSTAGIAGGIISGLIQSQNGSLPPQSQNLRDPSTEINLTTQNSNQNEAFTAPFKPNQRKISINSYNMNAHEKAQAASRSVSRRRAAGLQKPPVGQEDLKMKKFQSSEKDPSQQRHPQMSSQNLQFGFDKASTMNQTLDIYQNQQPSGNYVRSPRSHRSRKNSRYQVSMKKRNGTNGDSQGASQNAFYNQQYPANLKLSLNNIISNSQNPNILPSNVGGPKLYIKQQNSSKSQMKKKFETSIPTNQVQSSQVTISTHNQKQFETLPNFTEQYSRQKNNQLKLSSFDSSNQKNPVSHKNQMIPTKTQKVAQQFIMKSKNGSQPNFQHEMKEYTQSGQRLQNIDNGYPMQTSPIKYRMVRSGSRNNQQYNTIQYSNRVSKQDIYERRDNSLNAVNFPKNHFKQSKKQSVQNYISSSLVPNMKNNMSNGGKLVSNVASISQSQVNNLAGHQPSITSNKFNINSVAQTLKSRYGRVSGRTGKSQRSTSKNKQNQKNLNNNRIIGNSQVFMGDVSPGENRNDAQFMYNNSISQSVKPGNFEIVQSPQLYEAQNRIPQKKLAAGSIKARKNTTQVSMQYKGTSDLYQAHNSGGVINGSYVSGGIGIKSDAPLSMEWNQKSSHRQKRSIESKSGSKTRISKNSLTSNIKVSSPISILDNNAKYLTQMAQENQQIQKQDSQNSMNFTQQIRKSNKIQIRKNQKRIQQELQQEQFPQSLLTQGQKLLDQNEKSQALDKFLEYIKVQPLDSKIHFKIGLIYKDISEDETAQMDKIYATQESILHFEQVVKHVQNKNDSDAKDDKYLPAMSIFNIVQIHIKQMDFYQANFQLDRASHFGYQSLNENEKSKKVSQNLQIYKQFVDAVILLMKQQISQAMDILNEISKIILTGTFLEGLESSEMKQRQQFKYMVFTYRAYGFIIKKQYKKSTQDLEMAVKDGQFDQASKFNLSLSQLLLNKSHDDEKLNLILKLRDQFPDNKDVIRYHAIFIIQRQLAKEIDISQKSKQAQFKEMMSQDLKNLSSTRNNQKIPGKSLKNPSYQNQEKQLKKSMSQSNKVKDKRESQLGNLDVDKETTQTQSAMNNDKFYEQIATSNVDNPKKHQVMLQALEIINHGLSFAPKDRNLLLTRSNILFYMHDFYDALCDIDAVIDIERAASGEEEPNATDLLQKGRCHACLSMFKEAIEDFTKVIDLDDELFDAYYYRGKCSYLIGDTSQAFLDFQKLILLQPKNPMVHAYAGNLLMTTGSYEDAAKAFTNADSVQPCAFAIYQRARCLLAIGDFKMTLADLQKACDMFEQKQSGEQNNSNLMALRDKLCLENILSCIELLDITSIKIQGSKNDEYEDEEEEDDQKELKTFSIIDLNNQSEDQKHEFSEILTIFDQLIDMNQIELRSIPEATEYPRNSDNNGIKNFININQDSRMQQQIIPNVTRIKIEKVRALRRAQAKLEMAHMNRQKKKKSTANMLIFNIDYDDTDQRMKKDGQKICPWSYYMENLFSKDDLILYRGIIFFYLNKQPEAIRDFKKSQRTKNMYKILDNETAQQATKSRFTELDNNESDDFDNLTSEEDDPSDVGVQDKVSTLKTDTKVNVHTRNSQESITSDQTDLSDVGLCSLNKHEMYFNVALCMIQMGKYRRAIKIIDKLLEKCPSKYTTDIVTIRNIVQNWLTSVRVSTEAMSNQNSDPHFIQPFGSNHRLCRFFPWVKFESKTGRGETFISRPSFSFPFVKPPNMIPNVDESLLFNEFGPSKEDQNIPQPQALWIKTHELKQKPKSKNKTLGGLPRESFSKGDPESKQPIVHYQFTDTIIQQSESYQTETSQSQSQSYMGDAQSQLQGSISQSNNCIELQNIDECGEIIVEAPKMPLNINL